MCLMEPCIRARKAFPKDLASAGDNFLRKGYNLHCHGDKMSVQTAKKVRMNMDFGQLRELYEEHLGDRMRMTRWEALAQSLVDMIHAGDLAPGERLPTHRALADLLGVTVGTVSRAYARCAQLNLTQGIVGRGTFVTRPAREVDVYAQRPLPRTCLDSSARRSREPGEQPFDAKNPLDMGFITPFEHLNPSLEEGLAGLLKRGGLDVLGGYQAPAGRASHREAGALWAARFGLPVAPDNVLVCAGAQHALLTVLASLFNPGDRIAAEQLSYPLLRHLAQMLRLQLCPIRMDKNGIVPSALEAACRTRIIRGLYLMPSCHNPTLSLIPEFRRHEIVDICRRHDVSIIEDDVYALSLEQHLPPLSRLAPERSCFIASTSEALGAGLRVAYLCAPAHALKALEHTISYTISMAPPLMAELASLWIGDGTADNVLVAKRRAAAKANMLARDILDGFSLITRTTGFFCWLKLPGGAEAAREFAERARQQGLVVADSSYFAVGGSSEDAGVRLALGLKDQDILARALRCLAELLQRGQE